jgi:oxalate decarboxylase
VLAATAGRAMTAASMTTAEAAPVKSDISFGNPNDPPQGAINARIQEHQRSRSAKRRSGTSFGSILPPPTDVGSMPLS